MDNTNKAERSGKAIGGGDLWRVMQNGVCVGTIVHSHVTDLWHVTKNGKTLSVSDKHNAFVLAGVRKP